MRATVRVFLTLLTKSVWGSLTDKKLLVGQLFTYVQRSFPQNLELLGWKIRELWMIELKFVNLDPLIDPFTHAKKWHMKNYCSHLNNYWWYKKNYGVLQYILRWHSKNYICVKITGMNRKNYGVLQYNLGCDTSFHILHHDKVLCSIFGHIPPRVVFMKITVSFL